MTSSLADTFGLLPLQKTIVWEPFRAVCVVTVRVAKDCTVRLSTTESIFAESGFETSWSLLTPTDNISFRSYFPLQEVMEALDDSVGGNPLSALMVAKYEETALNTLAVDIRAAMSLMISAPTAFEKEKRRAHAKIHISNLVEEFEHGLGKW